MKRKIHSASCGLLSVVLIFSMATGAGAGEAIKAGEKVRIEFACRLPNGELAATTDPGLSDRPDVARAGIFKKRTNAEPLVITAGSDEAVYGKPGRRGFEGEIVAKLAEAVAGMPPGEGRTIELKATVQKDLPPSERFLEMNPVRTRPKEMRMSRDVYRSRTGKEAAEGQAYTIDPAFPGKVASVSGEEVVIVFSAEPGGSVETPLGMGTVRDGGKFWEIAIDAKVGGLVRSGNMVGRIVAVEERIINIDYGHPFGGEVLKCDVKAARPEEVKP
jgi:FKBP-type peptidyl-prolyl cis-trans isomerase 2